MTLVNQDNYISLCQQEETDTHIFLHVKYASSVSHTRASIRAVDSDSVLMIDVALFHKK